ncbi:phasin-related domain-containing protein [Leptospira brenneri]|uniref:Chemotaxis protein n=1 Tax=Leptospira brenneri TaxID=2023182 RepID=A0A2M9Y3V7_9LEPT|nr:chemotaxis protein [Leptospira brenneri]PJZ46169.1 chemotaxis protein [Leptospira brenneri]TGK96263.1 chemotaxis protein [Leptospira brenneri]
MEKQIMDILNAGIGLFQSGKEGLDKAKTSLETTYNELVSKGALDNTEDSVKIRQSVDKILTDIKEFSSVAGKNYDETRSKIVDNYNKIAEEIKAKMPEGKIESVKAKINEVAESIKKTGAAKA